MITCSRLIHFCAGHRVAGHENKCKNIHGHNYLVTLTARGVDSEVDGIGRVIDFSVLKDKVGGWVEREWDHGFIHWHVDMEVRHALEAMPGTKTFALPYNPTAENLAKFLLAKANDELLAGTGVRLVSVRVDETPNCFAECVA